MAAQKLLDFSPTLRALRDYRLYIPNPTFGNPTWEESGCRVLVMRLSPFNDVQRSTPHLFLAREVRAALPKAFIDMAFLPRPADSAELAAAGVPLIVGTQSHRTLREFDIALVSNSWLLEQVNLPFLLSRSGAPAWASQRGDEWPPLVLGGSNSTAAHALVSASGDCMADAIFFGEGEGSVGKIVRLWAESAGQPKKDRLARVASQVPGFWAAGGLPGLNHEGACTGGKPRALRWRERRSSPDPRQQPRAFPSRWAVPACALSASRAMTASRFAPLPPRISSAGPVS